MFGAPNTLEAESPQQTLNRRPVTVLHVGDCEIHQALVMRYLRAMVDFAFTFVYADSEDEAVALFEPQVVGLVILEDELRQGTCGSILHKLRSIDLYVPAIALTSEASSHVAVDLLRTGIDAHLGKHELDAQGLAERIRETMARTDAWRGRNATPPVEFAPELPSWFGSLGAVLAS